ncbi:flagellar biosynthesis protein FlgM [Planktotalea arctica]|uniref:flagellar biosynthesis protein FlgM n=1 Tax=Planktotalea arctica TaxID=1481893 RepID=UPI000A16D7D7|nr:flagellar biosynthesis protein FlgM [Planktotalea arctica]
MVDATQNLTGTMTSIKMPDVSAAPRVNVSPGDSSQAANLGAAAPVNPVSAADRPAVQVDSAVAQVLAKMQEEPAPIDIEAVTRIQEAISTNDYPLDYSKIVDGLAAAFESLS